MFSKKNWPNMDCPEWFGNQGSVCARQTCFRHPQVRICYIMRLIHCSARWCIHTFTGLSSQLGSLIYSCFMQNMVNAYHTDVLFIWQHFSHNSLLQDSATHTCLTFPGNSFNNSISSFFFSPFYFHQQEILKMNTCCLTYLEQSYGFEQSPRPSVDAQEHDL